MDFDKNKYFNNHKIKWLMVTFMLLESYEKIRKTFWRCMQ